jgi:hypothetical protein
MYFGVDTIVFYAGRVHYPEGCIDHFPHLNRVRVAGEMEDCIAKGYRKSPEGISGN